MQPCDIPESCCRLQTLLQPSAASKLGKLDTCAVVAVEAVAEEIQAVAVVILVVETAADTVARHVAKITNPVKIQAKDTMVVNLNHEMVTAVKKDAMVVEETETEFHSSSLTCFTALNIP